jgi:hypothetical protein
MSKKKSLKMVCADQHQHPLDQIAASLARANAVLLVGASQSLHVLKGLPPLNEHWTPWGTATTTRTSSSCSRSNRSRQGSKIEPIEARTPQF